MNSNYTDSDAVKIASDGRFTLATSNGNSVDIESPWTGKEKPLNIYKKLDGDYVYLCAQAAADIDAIEICFLYLPDICITSVWTVSLEGQYLRQEQRRIDFKLLSSQRKERIHVTPSNHLLNLLAKHANDLEIYQFFRFVIGDKKAARSFMNQYASSIQPRPITDTPEPSVSALIVYNHNYARNIPLIESLYSSRFSNFLHILPNLSPDHCRCINAPFGSFSYHVAIYEGLKTYSRFLKRDDQWILIYQDDVCLHSRVDQHYLLEHLCASHFCCAHPSGLSIPHNPDDTWDWNERIRSSCEDPRNSVTGSGFEGYNALYSFRGFKRGVSDIFALRADLIEDFLESLGYYISMGVFPEVSIPTTLSMLCHQAASNCYMLPGIYLWEENRRLISDENWLCDVFINSDNYFVHPAKLSQQLSINKLKVAR